MRRLGVVGATGAVGTVTLELLAERGFDDVRAFASARSAGKTVAFGDRELVVEEATPEALAAGDLDLCFFSVGHRARAASSSRRPATAARSCIDKSDAYRLTDGIPLVVAGVNDDALDGDADRRQPELLGDPAHLRAQAAARRGRARARAARDVPVDVRRGRRRDRAAARARADGGRPRDGLGARRRRVRARSAKLRAETRKILALPELPLQATCVRVPVLVGHAQAVWVETEEPLVAERGRDAARAPRRTSCSPTSRRRRRRRDATRCSSAGSASDTTEPNGLALWVVNDNLRKGAALNAVQIAELTLAREPVSA